MFRFFVVIATIAVSVAFAPAARFGARSLQMAVEKPSAGKLAGAAIIASTLVGSSAFAADGPKFSFFGGGASSPFVMDENREDAIYSPYSPFGDGSKAAYNARKGSKEEIKFWADTLATAA
jgi:hypothetical protein